MAKGKLIKKDIREMAQDAIIAGMVFQYHAVSVEQIAADTGASPQEAQQIFEELREQMHRIAALFKIDPNAFDNLLDARFRNCRCG